MLGTAPVSAAPVSALPRRSTLWTVSISLGIIVSKNASTAASLSVATSLGVQTSQSSTPAASATASTSLGVQVSDTVSATSSLAPSISLGVAAALQPSATSSIGTAVALGVQAAIAAVTAAALRVGTALGALLGLVPVGGTAAPPTFDPRFVVAAPPGIWTVAARVLFTVAPPTLRWTVSAMQATRDFFPALAAGIDSRPGTFDFGFQLPPGVTVASVTSVTATVHAGTGDPSPQSIVNGAAAIVTPLPSPPWSGVVNGGVAQTFGGNGSGVGGTTYLVVCQVIGTDGKPYELDSHVSFYTPS